MKQLVRNLKILFAFFLILSIAFLSGIIWHQHKSQTILLSSAGENKEALRARYSAAGDILSSDGEKLAFSSDGTRYYAEDPVTAQAFLQLVGDYTHNIGNTIEGVYQDRLIGVGRPFFTQLKMDFTGHGLTGDSIVLTADSRLTKTAYQTMSGFNGSAVILNYKTGDVLAAISTPSTSPQNVINWENIPDTALFNRALRSTYVPGSTFKLLTGYNWVHSDAYRPDYTVQCKGREPLLGEGSVNENRNDAGHGVVNLQEAYAVSCNHFFGDIILRPDRSNLDDTFATFHLNRPLALDGLSVSTSIAEPPPDDFSLTWFGIGQPLENAKLGITPLQMAMIAGTIANDGEMMQPHIVKQINTPDGGTETVADPTVLHTADAASCRIIAEDLRTVVERGTGTNAYRDGLTICGKTGTAQGTDPDGNLTTNSLFVGFLDMEEAPYAVAVVLENTSSGAPWIAGELLSSCYQIKP